jgi:hypothetical protein
VPPDGLLKASKDAWNTWFGSWIAAHWGPEDLPMLRVVILLYDSVQRGEGQRIAELRMWADTYGISPKGQQDRRWVRPEESPKAAPKFEASERYGHLRSVDRLD